MSVLGWMIVLLACISIPFGWNVGRTMGFVEVVLTVLTVLAGLVLVWQNISALKEYIRIPFLPSAQPDDQQPVSEIKKIMRDVDEGGWQDAYAAIGMLKELQSKYDLPKLE
jgi:hypothetical protein